MLTSTDAVRTLTTSRILEVGFPAQGSARAVAAKRQLAVHMIPQGTEPRWIILGDPRKARPVLSSWQPWKLSSRFQWNAVLMASSVGMLHRLPRVSNSHAWIDPSYWMQRLPDFPVNWNAVMHVGSRSFTRKAILFFFAENGEVKAAAKVPLEVAAVSAILHEATVLDSMEGSDYLPKVLFRDAERGIAAQSWLEGRPVSRGFTPAHLDLLSRLVNPGRGSRVSDNRAEIAAQLEALDLPFDRSRLMEALEVLDFDESLQGFVEHRDFAPWNLKWLPDGRLGLLDWEWAVRDSLPWQDVCRFFYLEDAHFAGPGKVIEAMNSNRLLQLYRQQFGISPTALTALTMHYLLRVLCMDWQSGNTRLAQYTFRQLNLLLDSRRKPAARR
jgi:hypothetical protein